MSRLTLQYDNVTFNIALRQGDNVTMLQLMSKLMSQCDNVANNITLYKWDNWYFMGMDLRYFTYPPFRVSKITKKSHGIVDFVFFSSPNPKPFEIDYTSN